MRRLDRRQWVQCNPRGRSPRETEGFGFFILPTAGNPWGRSPRGPIVLRVRRGLRAGRAATVEPPVWPLSRGTPPAPTCVCPPTLSVRGAASPSSRDGRGEGDRS